MSAVTMQVDISKPVKRRKAKENHRYEQVRFVETAYAQNLRQFNEFATAHPEILILLCKMAFNKMKSKRWQVHKPPIRINRLWEELRDDFRERGIKLGMSNNMKPFYAREMMRSFPELKAHMEVRNQFSAMKQKMVTTWIEVLVEPKKEKTQH